MIFTRRFGALAARPQFPDSPELQQELSVDVELPQHGETADKQDQGERVSSAA